VQERFASVVVLTRNRAASLARTLEALTALDYPAYEIVVVNNGSTDNTAEVISSYAVESVFCPEPNISLCRQRGVEAAKGDVIATCDDDCVPDRAWLRHLVSRLQSEENIGLVGGQIVNVGFPERQRYKGRGRIGRHGRLVPTVDPQKADYFGAANQAFKRAAVEAVGGYDPFFRSGYEEVDLILRLRQVGFQVVYEHQALVEHHFTGLGHKRRFFYSASTLRIYFYLKHFQPRTLAGWLGFLGLELLLLCKEILAVPYHLVRMVLGKELRQWSTLGVRLFNSVSGRLAIPWLLFEIRSRRALEGIW
jgi:GT2 family glycosyltransferase